MKDKWMKIKWAVCKKDDLAKFKADLVGHTESIQLLFATVQMSKADLHDKKHEERQKSLAGRIQESYFNCMQRLTIVLDQGKSLLDMTSSIFTNIKVFQIMLQLQQFITRMPGQVERQQPVHMIDALGRTSPFHLDFVRSAEALTAVLKVNFRKHRSGEEKIDRGEFVIQDVATKQDIDLNTDWELCFFPGQRVVMSVILNRALIHDVTCPKCGAPNSISSSVKENADIDCPVCGLAYRRLDDEIETVSRSIPFTAPPAPMFEDEDTGDSNIFGPPRPSLKRKRAEEEVADFRHVRLRNQTPESDQMNLSTPQEGHIVNKDGIFGTPDLDLDLDQRLQPQMQAQ
ncbi:hypothetical protein BDZ45DRAFT_758459 [Acephala macrosclerotiorum]|nr:hypothetical protein BDZ45DRAFT_758459 [Acephala macrosclerotiorum]